MLQKKRRLIDRCYHTQSISSELCCATASLEQVNWDQKDHLSIANSAYLLQIFY